MTSPSTSTRTGYQVIWVFTGLMLFTCYLWLGLCVLHGRVSLPYAVITAVMTVTSWWHGASLYAGRAK